MPKIKRDSEGLWRTAVTVRGRRVYIKSKSRQDVEEQLGELLQNKDRALQRPLGHTFSDVAALFLQHKEANGNEDSLRFYQHHVTVQGGMNTLLGPRGYADLKLADYLHYLDVRRTTPGKRKRLLAVQTVDHERSILLQIAFFAEDRGLIERSPINSRKLPKLRIPEKAPRALEGHEISAIYRECPPEYHVILDVFLHTGLRISEAKRLDWTWVDLDRTVMVVKAAKSGKLRTIPLSATAVAALRSLPLKTGRVIEDNFDDILGSGRIYAVLRTIARRLKMRRFGLHALRHTFCTSILRATKNVYAVEKLAGHSDPKITRRYVAVLGEELRGEIDKLDEHLNQARALVPIQAVTDKASRPVGGKAS